MSFEHVAASPFIRREHAKARHVALQFYGCTMAKSGGVSRGLQRPSTPWQNQEEVFGAGSSIEGLERRCPSNSTLASTNNVDSLDCFISEASSEEPASSLVHQEAPELTHHVQLEAQRPFRRARSSVGIRHSLAVSGCVATGGLRSGRPQRAGGPAPRS
mmetsp:Transcript_144154/g.401631  ORF Transcript_144154/g.401631 Transcript_144154/m.401631 type:complete len:159 (-) Transcript_144154:82-558(-)